MKFQKKILLLVKMTQKWDREISQTTSTHGGVAFWGF
jgi:hypothetical protein